MELFNKGLLCMPFLNQDDVLLYFFVQICGGDMREIREERDAGGSCWFFINLQSISSNTKFVNPLLNSPCQ